MEEELASLSISDDEEDLMQNQVHEHVVEEDFRLLLVGSVLTKSVASHFISLVSIGEGPLQVPSVFADFWVARQF
ncbi:hypothetical protein Goari_005991, partial [Gossypium aridum]|nr:hypothetical protein [Gossypium aridum]